MKLPLPDSFAYLCGFVGTLHDCIGVLAAGKQDVNAVVSLTIPTSGWGTDNTVPSHPFYLDIAVTGVSDTDIVALNVAPASVTAARAAGFFSATQSYSGGFRLRSKHIPETEIQVEYHITNTAEYAV